MNWSNYFLGIAEAVKVKSKDPSTQVGAVAVGPDNELLCTAFNGLPRRVKDTPHRLTREEKHKGYMVHAEANLVAVAARHGISLKGAMVVCTHEPCASCAALLIQSGIAKIVVNAANKTKMPPELFAIAQTMLEEADVPLVKIRCEGVQ